MAINPQIPLMAQGVDLGQALLSGLQGAQSIQAMQQAAAEQPLRQQALEQSIAAKQYEADLLKSGVTASKLKPFIAAKDYDGFAKELQRSGLSAEDIGTLDTYARANRWDQLGSVADQYIQTARDAGVFQRDYAAAGADGYTPSAVQLFEYRKRLVASGASKKEIETFDSIVRNPMKYGLGGGLENIFNTIGRTTTTLPITETTGAQLPGEVNIPPPAGDQSASSQTLQTPVESKTASVTPTTPEDSNKALSGNITKSAAQAYSIREQNLAFAKETGTLDAKEVAEITKQVNSTRSNFAKFNARFRNLNLEQALKDSPQTGLSSFISRNSAFFINGLSSERAKAKLEPLFEEMVKLQPFPPGAQSQPELEARRRAVGDILGDGRMTPQDKYEMIMSYFDGINAEAKSQWEILNETRQRNNMERLPTPYDEGTLFGGSRSPSGGGMTQPAGGVSPGQFKVRRIQ